MDYRAHAFLMRQACWDVSRSLSCVTTMDIISCLFQHKGWALPHLSSVSICRLNFRLGFVLVDALHLDHADPEVFLAKLQVRALAGDIIISWVCWFFRQSHGGDSSYPNDGNTYSLNAVSPSAKVRW